MIYESFFEPIGSSDILVCHTCDNRACVNPHHFFLGSTLDNMRDMFAKGRRDDRKIQGEKHGKATIDDALATEILKSSLSYQEAADHFNVSYLIAYHIKTRRAWKHLS